MLNIKFLYNWLSSFIGNVILLFSWTVGMATKAAMATVHDKKSRLPETDDISYVVCHAIFIKT